MNYNNLSDEAKAVITETEFNNTVERVRDTLDGYTEVYDVDCGNYLYFCTGALNSRGCDGMIWYCDYHERYETGTCYLAKDRYRNEYDLCQEAISAWGYRYCEKCELWRPEKLFAEDDDICSDCHEEEE